MCRAVIVTRSRDERADPMVASSDHGVDLALQARNQQTPQTDVDNSNLTILIVAVHTVVIRFRYLTFRKHNG
jgi:hypothetical protein